MNTVTVCKIRNNNNCNNNHQNIDHHHHHHQQQQQQQYYCDTITASTSIQQQQQQQEQGLGIGRSSSGGVGRDGDEGGCNNVIGNRNIIITKQHTTTPALPVLVLHPLEDATTCNTGSIGSLTRTTTAAAISVTKATTISSSSSSFTRTTSFKKQQQQQQCSYPRICSPRKRRRGTYQIPFQNNTSLPVVTTTTTIFSAAAIDPNESNNTTTSYRIHNPSNNNNNNNNKSTTTVSLGKITLPVICCLPPKIIHSNIMSFITSITKFLPIPIQQQLTMIITTNTKTILLSSSKAITTTTTSTAQSRCYKHRRLTKTIARKLIPLFVFCIVCIILFIQIQGEHQVLQNIITTTRQVSSSLSTLDNNSNDNVVLVDDDILQQQQQQLRTATNTANRNTIKELQHSSTIIHQQQNNNNNINNNQQHQHEQSNYHHISFVRRNTEQRKHVYGNLTTGSTTASTSYHHHHHHHHHHVIPNIITFTHKYNLLTKQFPYNIYNATTTDEIEMIALQQNIHYIISLHPNATIKFLTNKECIESIQRVMTLLYPNDTTAAKELVQYFRNETEGMFKGDLCRGVTLYETGGIYLDVDIGVRMNLWSVLPAWTEFVTVKVHEYSRDYGSFFQAFIGVIPHHPVIGKYIQYFYDYYRGTLSFQNQLNGRPVGVVLLKRAYDAIQQEQLIQLQQQQQQQDNHEIRAEQHQEQLQQQIQNQRRDVEEDNNNGTPVRLTHLDQTSVLWQETLYRRHMRRDPNYQNVPYPSWGMVRACRFIVVANNTVPTSNTRPSSNGATKNTWNAFTTANGEPTQISYHNDVSSEQQALSSSSSHDQSTNNIGGIAVPFYSRIANSRLCPVRPNYFTVPMLDWINYVLFYH